jgi:hypothetical protein
VLAQFPERWIASFTYLVVGKDIPKDLQSVYTTHQCGEQGEDYSGATWSCGMKESSDQYYLVINPSSHPLEIKWIARSLLFLKAASYVSALAMYPKQPLSLPFFTLQNSLPEHVVPGTKKGVLPTPSLHYTPSPP